MGFKFKENDEVMVMKYEESLNGKTGFIKGISTMDFPFIGAIYIVQFAEPLSEEYPFSSVAIPEINLKLFSKYLEEIKDRSGWI